MEKGIVDTPAQDCIWKGLLHHETPPAHPSASLRSLRKKKRNNFLLTFTAMYYNNYYDYYSCMWFDKVKALLLHRTAFLNKG